MAAIFISYRKTEVDKGSSLHLAEDLRESLGDDAVFRYEKGLGLGKFDDQQVAKNNPLRPSGRTRCDPLGNLGSTDSVFYSR